ncbi:MAG: hypothetical protein Q8O29_07850, partial [Polaromonas sp.]
MSKLDICDLPGESPVDGAVFAVAALLPSLDVALEGGARGKARVQALARQYPDFDLGHIQPAGVLGGVVKSHPAQQLGSPALTQDINKASCEVSVQIVQHKMQAPSPAVSGGQKVAHQGDEVGLAAMVGYDNRSDASLGLNRHEQVASAPAHVFVVFFE